MPTPLYSLNIRWVKTLPNPEEVDKILTRAGDWLRFNAWSWLVATDYPVQDVSAALRTVLASEDSILIIRCDPNDYSGFAQKWVWDWINKYQTRSSNPLSAGLGGPHAPGGLLPPSPLDPRWKIGNDR
jgi:hypothetical protein